MLASPNVVLCCISVDGTFINPIYPEDIKVASASVLSMRNKFQGVSHALTSSQILLDSHRLRGRAWEFGRREGVRHGGDVSQAVSGLMLTHEKRLEIYFSYKELMRRLL